MRDTGYELAAAMGLTATRHFNDGEDGTVYLLDDGRVLKITDSEPEAAICLRLLDLRIEGKGHPSVPLVDSVTWIEDTANEPEEDGSRAVYYAILREDFGDVSYVEIDETEWEAVLGRLNGAWKSGSEEAIRQAMPTWDPYLSLATELMDGLRWIREHVGATVLDLREPNVGVGGSRQVGMRDLSRARLPGHIVERVFERDFPQAPRPASLEVRVANAP